MTERRTKTPLFDRATRLLQEEQQFHREALIGVETAEIRPRVKYSDLPLALANFADIHYGSIHGDYPLLTRHLGIVEDTPNMVMGTNGDDIDNFNVIVSKLATGTFENPLPPQIQATAYMEKIYTLDKEGKLVFMSYGNHNNFGDSAGYDWLETWARNLPRKIPIFTSGGELRLKVGKEGYDIGISHRHWGSSKLNPTNAIKRFMEYEYPNADMLSLAHTHQSEVIVFERGGKERVGVIAGTYKQGLEGHGEPWARQMGIGTRAGRPGITVLFYPNQHKMEVFKHIEDAQDYIGALVYRKEHSGIEHMVFEAGRERIARNETGEN